MVLGALAGCSGDPEVGVTTLPGDAGEVSGASTSATASTASTASTAAPSTAKASTGDDEYSIATTSTQAKQPPTSTPSAKRLDDGSVVSAGGYVARTPSVANGMLKEPQWSLEQQPYVDMLHEYFDEFYLAQADGVEPTGKPTPEMLALEDERKDLNPQGIRFPRWRLERRKATGTMATWPESSKSQVVITGMSTTEYSQNFRVCELNDQVARTYPGGIITDAAISSDLWTVAVSKQGEEPKLQVAINLDHSNDVSLCDW
jgi:hypothetical protein